MYNGAGYGIEYSIDRDIYISPTPCILSIHDDDHDAYQFPCCLCQCKLLPDIAHHIEHERPLISYTSLCILDPSLNRPILPRPSGYHRMFSPPSRSLCHRISLLRYTPPQHATRPVEMSISHNPVARNETPSPTPRRGGLKPRLTLLITARRPTKQGNLVLNGVNDVTDNSEDNKEEDDDDGDDDVAFDHFFSSPSSLFFRG
jgi:hypothetical protein